MTLESRIARLEARGASDGCPSCADRPRRVWWERQPSGSELVFWGRPPCPACGLDDARLVKRFGNVSMSDL